MAIQHQNQVNLRDENQVLRQQLDRHAQQQSENERLLSLSAQTNASVALTEDQISELLRLRGEVGRLRQQAAELEALRKETEQLRAALASRTAPGESARAGSPRPDEIAAAKAVIFNPAAGVGEKLAALRTLRSANDRGDDVVKQMVQAYYSTDNQEWRADIFRQLNGITTPELKRPLLEAISDPAQPSKVREEAAETLAGYLSDPDVKTWLEHLAANDSDRAVRAQANRSL